MHWTAELFLGVLGLVIGSFLNVCIHRIPRGESIVFPASRCPSCGLRLGPADLVPVLSWVLLRGKCRTCGARISPRYPVVEALTGVAFWATARWAPGTLTLVRTLVLVCILIVVCFIDLEHLIIPDRIVFPAAGVGLVFAFLDHRLLDSLTGLAVGFGGFLLIAWAGGKLARREAMGGGDIKFAGALGAFLGWQDLLLALFLSFLAGALIAVPLWAFRRKGMRDAVPFGPMMCVGAAVTVAAGPWILQQYGRLLTLLWG